MSCSTIYCSVSSEARTYNLPIICQMVSIFEYGKNYIVEQMRRFTRSFGAHIHNVLVYIKAAYSVTMNIFRKKIFSF